jgi:type II secretory pathway component PulC
MKQQTWIINSSLLVIFVVLVSTNMLLKKELPKLRLITTSLEETEKKKQPIQIELAKIYSNDIFDTYAYAPTQPIKKSLITPIPEPKLPPTTSAPEIKKSEFIDPLNVTLKGIILSSEDSSSVAMFADETNKEGIYHLGDRVKDGQIIRISRNKIVVLRANGQQEVFLLRKVEIPEEAPTSKWQFTVKKIDDSNYEIDPTEFTKEITSLGSLIENLSLGTAYKNSVPVGIRLGKIDATSIGSALGMNEHDIINSINSIKTSDVKNRIKIYDAITQTKIGDTIKVSLNRSGREINLNYKLSKIPKPSKFSFIQPAAGQPSAPASADIFKPSDEQRREEIQRQFKNIHYSPHQQNIIEDIRARLRENMKSRALSRRVR